MGFNNQQPIDEEEEDEEELTILDSQHVCNSFIILIFICSRYRSLLQCFQLELLLPHGFSVFAPVAFCCWRCLMCVCVQPLVRRHQEALTVLLNHRLQRTNLVLNEKVCCTRSSVVASWSQSRRILNGLCSFSSTSTRWNLEGVDYLVNIYKNLPANT